VCELVTVSNGKRCVVNLSDSEIVHSLRSEVQRLHGDYGLALVYLSLRGLLLHRNALLHMFCWVDTHPGESLIFFHFQGS